MAEINRHGFKGQEFYDKQCKINADWAYAHQRGGAKPPEGTRRCAFCGSDKYYAKNLCRACYNRMVRGLPLERTYEHESNNQKQIKYREGKKGEPFNVKLTRRVLNHPYPMEINEEEIALVEDKLGGLSDRQVYIINQHYGEGRTLRDIGSELGMTHERVRQIENAGMRRLRSEGKVVDPNLDKKLDTSVFCGYRMSARSKHALRKAKIRTMKKLGEVIGNGQLNEIKGIGVKSANEIMLIFTDWFYNRADTYGQKRNRNKTGKRSV